MASENIPAKDAQYAPWIINFASVATANATLLNLSSGQTTFLTANATAFDDALTDSVAKKAASKGATTTKQNLRKSTEALFRSTAKAILANTNVPADVKAELGLNTSPIPVGPVSPVENLAVSGTANGVNSLVWNRNGNAPSTMFRIEARYGASLNWTFVANTTRVKYDHSGQTPGVQVTYRIISQRGIVVSEPSNMAVVYDPEESETFSLREAA